MDYSGTGYAVDSVNFTRDEETLKSHVTGLNANGGTQTDSGLEKAKELVAAVPEYRTSHKIVILLTDGAPSQQGLDGRPYGEAISANEQADAIKQLGAEIYQLTMIFPAAAAYPYPLHATHSERGFGKHG